jgi:hypothetical protein
MADLTLALAQVIRDLEGKIDLEGRETGILWQLTLIPVFE